MGTLSYSQHLIRYELSFALFLVVKQSSPDNVAHKKSANKEKSTKKSHGRTKSTSAQSGTTESALAEHSEDLTKKKHQRSGQKDHSVTRSKGKSKETILEGKMEQEEQVGFDADTKKSTRPENEVVTYAELDFALKEIPPQDNKVLIGPLRLTRFEKARITGARSLQLSLGAPSFISVSPDIRDSISLAIAEIDSRALPISIRRILPNGLYQDIPIDWMKL